MQNIFDDFAVETAFSFIKRTLERDMEAYEKRCIARSENGKKGGRPKKDDSDKNLKKANITKEKLNKAKKAHTETDIDTDTDTDIDKDTDTDTEINISTSSSSEMRGGEFSGVYSDDFLDYPKKMGKGAAYKVFNKLKLGKKEKADIITALNWQKKSEQ